MSNGVRRLCIGAVCVSCSYLSLLTNCSVYVGAFLAPKDTVPTRESVLLFSDHECYVHVGEEGIAGFRKCVRFMYV
jgi:hypothetical protein